MKNVKLIAFDYDGVIADSFDHNLETVNKVLSDLGHNKLSTPDDIKNLQRMTFGQLGLDLGVPSHMVSHLEMKTAEELIKTTHMVNMFNGIKEVFHTLAKEYKLAVISNTISHAIEQTFSREELSSYFTSIYGGDHEGSKAEKLQELCKINKLQPAEVCMVGDALSDITAAKEAGTKSIAVTWGFQSRELLSKVDPDLIIDNISDFKEIF